MPNYERKEKEFLFLAESFNILYIIHVLFLQYGNNNWYQRTLGSRAGAYHYKTKKK